MAWVSGRHVPLEWGALSVLLAVLAVGVMAEASESVVYPRHENFWSGRVRALHHRYHKQNNEMHFGCFPPDTIRNAFVKFDLSSVPNLSVIKQTKLFYRVVQVTVPCPPSHVTVLTADPSSASAEYVYFDIESGRVAAGTVSHVTG